MLLKEGDLFCLLKVSCVCVLLSPWLDLQTAPFHWACLLGQTEFYFLDVT